MRPVLPTRSPFRGAVLAALALLFAAPGDSGQSREIDLTTATIAEINEAVDAGVLTAERLVELCLARIEAYDDQGPRINAVIAVNPNARERARAMDAERERSGRRSPLHGIPVLLKDNFDTADIPTTAGSFLLQDSRPPDDAFVVRKLREAGAIVLAKVNLSEFASGGAMSSLGGITRNPHDPTRTPAGSSGGTGAAVAAGYGFVGLGSDTGGSIRGPSTANGLAGLKPTLGLLSRDGIVPLALSFDTRRTDGAQRVRRGGLARNDGGGGRSGRGHVEERRAVPRRLHAVPGPRGALRGAPGRGPRLHGR